MLIYILVWQLDIFGFVHDEFKLDDILVKDLWMGTFSMDIFD